MLLKSHIYVIHVHTYIVHTVHTIFYIQSLSYSNNKYQADDGYNYLMTTIWKDRSGYEAFATSTADGFTIPAASAGKIFYEGKLVLINEKGI